VRNKGKNKIAHNSLQLCNRIEIVVMKQKREVKQSIYVVREKENYRDEEGEVEGEKLKMGDS
jgi:hypothetical protein